MAGLRKTIAPSWLAFALILFLVFIIWVLSGWLLYSMRDRGTFGDMFGAVNALFSGFGFAALIYTIYLQRNEIRLQQQELSLTKSEIQNQKEQLLVQNDVLRIQNFESTFFQLLRLLNDIVLDMDLKIGDMKMNEIKGRACFSVFFEHLKQFYFELRAKHQQTNANMMMNERIEIAYQNFYKNDQNYTGHYFRTLYNVMKFVDESAVINKKFYINLLRAQLSNHELLVLFYNCQSTLGGPKFKALVEKYALFKSISANLLIDPQHKSLYQDQAYQL